MKKKDYSCITETIGDFAYTTIGVATPIKDSPPPTQDEQDRALIQSTANTILKMKVEMSNIAFWLMIVGICQIAQCTISLVKH